MSFENLKKRMTENIEKTQPNFMKTFILITDTSNSAIGALLIQENDQGKEQIIYSFSRGLEQAEKNYRTTDKELLAIVKSIDHFRHYLIGKEFIARTDHQALEYIWTCDNPTTRMLQWALKLQEYKFTVQYIKDDKNIADGISRNTYNIYESKNLQIKIDKQEEQCSILNSYHIKSGHGKETTIKFLIKQNYNWKNINKDIKEYIKTCAVCQKEGNKNINTKNNIIKSYKPNKIWQCDLIGMHKNETGENFYIFIGVDQIPNISKQK